MLLSLTPLSIHRRVADNHWVFRFSRWITISQRVAFRCIIGNLFLDNFHLFHWQIYHFFYLLQARNPLFILPFLNFVMHCLICVLPVCFPATSSSASWPSDTSTASRITSSDTWTANASRKPSPNVSAALIFDLFFCLFVVGKDINWYM